MPDVAPTIEPIKFSAISVTREGIPLGIECAEPGCANAVVKPERGRTSRYCPEHKRGGDKAPKIDTPRAASWPKAREIETALTRYVALIGSGVTFINAADGEAVILHGPAVVHEIVELGRNDKRIRRALELLSMPGKYGPLTLAIASLALPLLANHGLIPSLIVDLTKPTLPNKNVGGD